jgi:membrane protein
LAIVAALVIMIIIWYATTNLVNYVISLQLPFIQEIEIQRTLFWKLSSSALIYIATQGFTWFLQSGVVNYQLIYGSLGTILAFLTWVYITAFIVIMGAHISSSIASHTRGTESETSPENK